MCDRLSVRGWNVPPMITFMFSPPIIIMSLCTGCCRARDFSVRMTKIGKWNTFSWMLSSCRMFALRRRMIAGASSNTMNSGLLGVKKGEKGGYGVFWDDSEVDLESSLESDLESSLESDLEDRFSYFSFRSLRTFESIQPTSLLHR